MSWHNPLSKKHQTRRANKYGAIRVQIDGKNFASKLEGSVYAALKLMERGGLIKDIRTQAVIQLTPKVKHRIDFVVFDIARGIDVGIEAKGKEDLRWNTLKQLYRDFAPIPIQIWKVSGSRPVMVEEIPVGKYEVKEK